MASEVWIVLTDKPLRVHEKPDIRAPVLGELLFSENFEVERKVRDRAGAQWLALMWDDGELAWVLEKTPNGTVLATLAGPPEDPPGHGRPRLPAYEEPRRNGHPPPAYDDTFDALPDSPPPQEQLEWEERFDPRTTRAYYVNIVTGEKGWRLPPNARCKPMEFSDESDSDSEDPPPPAQRARAMTLTAQPDRTGRVSKKVDTYDGPGEAVVFSNGSFGLGFAESSDEEYAQHSFPAVVGRVTAGGQGDISGGVSVDDAVVMIGSTSTRHMEFHDVIQLVKDAARPIRMVFCDQRLIAAWIAMKNADPALSTIEPSKFDGRYDVHTEDWTTHHFASPLHDENTGLDPVPRDAYDAHMGAAMAQASATADGSMSTLARARGRRWLLLWMMCLVFCVIVLFM